MTLRRMTALAVGLLLVIPALAFAVTPALAADRDPGNNTADATYVTPAWVRRSHPSRSQSRRAQSALGKAATHIAAAGEGDRHVRGSPRLYIGAIASRRQSRIRNTPGIRRRSSELDACGLDRGESAAPPQSGG